MRIVAGRLKGLRLAELGKGDGAAHLRPTSERVRESLFNVLASGYGAPAPGIRVLDLFAGTGALGLEALSRGAGHVVFVENGRVGQTLIRRNVDLARAGEAATVVGRDATRLGPTAAPPAGLVFLDPPYGKHLGERSLATAAANGWLEPQALVVWEEAAPQGAPEGFTVLAARQYGNTHVTLLRFGV